jgi:hypothetical protein
MIISEKLHVIICTIDPRANIGERRTGRNSLISATVEEYYYFHLQDDCTVIQIPLNHGLCVEKSNHIPKCALKFIEKHIGVFLVAR